MDGPLPGDAPTPVSLDFEDDFTSEAPDRHWNFVRNPRRENYRWERGRMMLTGGEDGLSVSCGHPTMLAVRQQEFCMEATAELSGAIEEGQCAGLSAFYTSDYHYDILVTRREGKLCVCLRKRVADIDVVVASHPIEEAKTETSPAEEKKPKKGGKKDAKPKSHIGNMFDLLTFSDV
jgi:beta-xylosidase